MRAQQHEHADEDVAGGIAEIADEVAAKDRPDDVCVHGFAIRCPGEREWLSSMRVSARRLRDQARGCQFVETRVEVLAQFADRSVVDQPAFVDEHHAAGDRLDFLQNVRRQQNRLAFAQAADRVADVANLVGIRAGRRLVQNQHVGLVQQHLGHADALPIALRELADRLADHAAQRAQVDDLVDPLAACKRPLSPRASAKNSSRPRGVMSG